MKNKKELSEKVKAILRDGRFFVSFVAFHKSKMHTVFENLNLPPYVKIHRFTLREGL
jgi:hypothetical protein